MIMNFSCSLFEFTSDKMQQDLRKCLHAGFFWEMAEEDAKKAFEYQIERGLASWWKGFKWTVHSWNTAK